MAPDFRHSYPGSEDLSENEEAGGRGAGGPYRRDSRDSEHDSDSGNRALEDDIRGSKEEDSEGDLITKVSYSVTEFLMVYDF